jgi:hypothetical protein
LSAPGKAQGRLQRSGGSAPSVISFRTPPNSGDLSTVAHAIASTCPIIRFCRDILRHLITAPPLGRSRRSSCHAGAAAVVELAGRTSIWSGSSQSPRALDLQTRLSGMRATISNSSSARQRRTMVIVRQTASFYDTPIIAARRAIRRFYDYAAGGRFLRHCASVERHAPAYSDRRPCDGGSLPRNSSSVRRLQWAHCYDPQPSARYAQIRSRCHRPEQARRSPNKAIMAWRVSA